MIDLINDLPFHVDFVLHTGDVVFDPHPEPYEAAKTLFSRLKYPIYYLNGNHDHRDYLQKILLGKAEAANPFDYEFEVNGVQIVCVDSNGPEAVPPSGHVTDAQLTWLQGICSAADPRPLVIATHHNMLPTGIPWLDNYMRTANGEQFHQAILPARARLRGVFFGHVHQNLDIYQDGILYCSTLSSWTQLMAYPGMDDTIRDETAQPGFSLVHITAQQTFIRRYRFSLETK